MASCAFIQPPAYHKKGGITRICYTGMRKRQDTMTKQNTRYNIQQRTTLFLIIEYCVLFLVSFTPSAHAQSDATVSPFSSRASITRIEEHPPLPLDKDIISSVYWYELLPATGNR